ncbi:Cellulase (glycosyl hydrolase family 5), putative [Verrucomicrobiia bacterium DG1235]|nr:Cellulase (glycosyl hydrolase family 5), putative [Verrucomicrobiae bacterium DG1235]
MTPLNRIVSTLALAGSLAANVHSQASYPSYNSSPLAPDSTGMTSVAAEIAGHIQAGWNIGNTLEAIGSETAWGNPMVTNELIQLVKENGFQAIRIPCSWDQYANQETAQIDPSWLDRVKTVVQHCIENDMYVLLNIHWDGGWLENNVTPERQADNNAKQKAFWEQIATHLRDFDERLLFASANEPNVDDATQQTVLLSYHQTFIDAVRSTGGKNAYRVLVVQGPATDIERTDELMDAFPTDTVPDRLMAEVHYYTPYNFALMTEDQSWGNQFYYWGEEFHSTTDTSRNANWGEEELLDELFALMKAKYVDQGIPVVIGEFAAIRRTHLTGENLELHLASRAYYLDYVTEKCNALGFLPFYWDAGGLDNHGSGIFDRDTNTIFDPLALEALTQIETEQYWTQEGPTYAANANPDGDWANNHLERYLGSDPRDETSIPAKPSLQIDANKRLAYTLHRYSKNNGLLEFEYSHDLSTWNPFPMNIQTDTNTLLEAISDPLPDDAPIFIRIKITL